MSETWGRGRTGSPYAELGKMVDVGLGDFTCGQGEMISWWYHGAAGHASVKVCARDTGMRASGQGGDGTTCFIRGWVCLKFPILLNMMSASHFHRRNRTWLDSSQWYLRPAIEWQTRTIQEKGEKKKKKKQAGHEKQKGNSVLKEHGADQLNQVDACPWKQITFKVKKDMKLWFENWGIYHKFYLNII